MNVRVKITLSTASETKLKFSVHFKHSFFVINCISLTRIFWRKLTPQLVNNENVPANTGRKYRKLPSGGILIWNRRLFAVFTSICALHTKRLLMHYFQALALVCLFSRYFNWLQIPHFFKKLFVLVMWFFHGLCHLKSELKIFVRWKLLSG